MIVRLAELIDETLIAFDCDIENLTCVCGFRIMTERICKHLAKALKEAHKDIYQALPSWCQCRIIRAGLAELAEGAVPIGPFTVNPAIIAPVPHAAPGRPRRKRISSIGEALAKVARPQNRRSCF
jgi:hypothetical protein